MGQYPSPGNKPGSVYQNPHHHSHPRLANLRDFLYSQGHILKQLATLKYGDFREAVETINKVTCSLESSGCQKSLVFSVVPGTDAVALLWKPQVRVKCCKVDANGTIESTRVLTLKQFVQVYSSIMQQLGGSQRANNNGGSSSSSSSTQDITSIDERGDSLDRRGSELDWLEISAIFANVQENSLESIDEGECCICMEQRVDVMLQCSHTYCQNCIDSWRLKHNTCPMCMGDMGTTKDIWAMPEKPAAEEVASYLMGIADDKTTEPHIEPADAPR